MALSKLTAFLTGKTIALTASVALAGGGAAVVTTGVADGQAEDGLAIAAAAVDHEDGANDGDRSEPRVDGQERADEAREDLVLPDHVDLDELVPTVDELPTIEEGENGEDDGDNGRSGDVHTALAGDQSPSNGRDFGAAVAQNAKDGRALGQSVAEAARGDNGPQDTPGTDRDTPAADASAAGQARADEARNQADVEASLDGTDGDDEANADASGDDAPALPDAAADRARSAAATG